MVGDYCLNCNSNCFKDIVKNNDDKAAQLLSVDHQKLATTFRIKKPIGDMNHGKSFLCTPCRTTYFEYLTARRKFRQRGNTSSQIAIITNLQGSKQLYLNPNTETADLIKTESADYAEDSTESNFSQLTPFLDVDSSFALENNLFRLPLTTKYSECDQTSSSKIKSDSHLQEQPSCEPSNCQFRNSILLCPYTYCAKTFTDCACSDIVAHIKRHEVFIVNKDTKIGTRLANFYNEETQIYSCMKCTKIFRYEFLFLKHFKNDHASEFTIMFLEDGKSKTNTFKCQKSPTSYPTQYLLQQNCGIYQTRGQNLESEAKRRSKSKSTEESISKSWSSEEDEKLKSLVLMLGEVNWYKIANNFLDRSMLQCKNRWTRLQRLHTWTREEDDQIVDLVGKHGIGNWTFIAKHLKRRLGEQCRARWNQVLRPEISKKPWTEEEDKLIHEAHCKYGNDCAKPATSLSGRTNKSIESRWKFLVQRNKFDLQAKSKTSKTEKYSRKKWRPEEDEKLKSHISTFGEDNWKEVANNFPDRSEIQCEERWTKIGGVNIIKSGFTWAKEEDDKIVELVAKHGAGKWAFIAKHLKGRNGKQCRERWAHHLRPEIKTESWTKEEDKLLYEAHSKYGNQWTKIAKFLPGRTSQSVRRQWRRLYSA